MKLDASEQLLEKRKISTRWSMQVNLRPGESMYPALNQLVVFLLDSIGFAHVLVLITWVATNVRNLNVLCMELVI